MRGKDELDRHFQQMMGNARDPREAMEIMRRYQEELSYVGGMYTMMPPPSIFGPSSGSLIGETASKSTKPLPEDHIVAAVTGYRAWNVPLFVDELRSVAKASKWKPYQRFEAVCEQSQCSGVACSCGIYAFNKMNLVQTEYTTSDRSKRYVYGECWLWGRVLECKDGYRAQFAYPKALVDNGAIAKRMAEIFGVALLAK